MNGRHWLLGLSAAGLAGGCAETMTTPAALPQTGPDGGSTEIRIVGGSELDAARSAYYRALATGTKRVRIQVDRVDTAAIYWATLETPALRSLRRDALALYELWTPEQRAAENIKDTENHHGRWTFSVVLYTQDSRDNLVSRSGSSGVRAFLLTQNGDRLEPLEVRKQETPKSRIEWLYPHKDRFSTVWQIVFPEPQNPGPVELQLTGPGFVSATSWE